MTYNAPNRVFKIGELTRLIAGQLVLLSRGSTTNLACTCRYLEEPVLSTLWEGQRFLGNLLDVLPGGDRACGCSEPGRHSRIVGDPSPEAWNRVRRYASWMRGLLVNQWSNIGEDVYYKLRLNSPPGGWFPALQELNWCITKSNHPYTSMFFSPHLKKVHLAIPWSPIQPEVLNGILPGFASTITVLPTSALQYLSIDTDDCGMRWECLQVSFSSVILRCGPSLTELTSPIPLSDAAKNHVIRLPHLHTWHVQGPPPNYSVSTLPSDFPPLVDFIIGEGGGPGWISLFKQLEGRTSSTQTPWSRVKESLKYLKVKRCSGLIIDIPFVSLIQRFRNLVGLEIEIHCYDGDGEGQCAFNLNDDNITKFAMALPQLESLVLGHPCSDNTCATTVASLLAVSVHCVKLEQLEIHFNTTNIVGDLEDILVAPRFQQLRSLPRCKLSSLDVSGIPLDLDESDFDTVVSGMIGIFPFLESCDGFERIWEEMFEEFWGDDDSPSASPEYP